MAAWPPLTTEDAVVRAEAGLRLVESGTARLLDLVSELSEPQIQAPSRLPGWRRSHVITHLARNADALVNLLIWARSGVEHPMYTSRADRDADIEEGSGRPVRVLIEDLHASSARFVTSANGLSDSDWQSEVVASRDRALAGHEVPWLRLQEVWIHLIDLNLGVEFDDLPDEVVTALLDKVAWTLHDRADVPPLNVTAEMSGGYRGWRINVGGPDEPHPVRGSGSAVLAWLTGRRTGTELSGALPDLPPWL